MSSSKIAHLRDFFLAFGTIGHYLKRLSEYNASRKTADPLPPRWLHLAERSLLLAPYPRYLEFAHTNEAQFSPERLARLDELVDRIRAVLRRPDVLASLRDDGSNNHQELSGLYRNLQHTLFGVKGTVPEESEPPS